jgi:hypothetical protein
VASTYKGPEKYPYPTPPNPPSPHPSHPPHPPPSLSCFFFPSPFFSFFSYVFLLYCSRSVHR